AAAAPAGTRGCTRPISDQPATNASATRTRTHAPRACAPLFPSPVRLPARSTYHGVRRENAASKAPPPASPWAVDRFTFQISAGRLRDEAVYTAPLELGSRAIRIRLNALPLLSVLTTRTPPTSAAEATWVPPSACRSTPSMSITRIGSPDPGMRFTFAL